MVVLCVYAEFGCNEADICGDNAECVLDPETKSYSCQCLDDFSGDGYTCKPTDRKCAHTTSLCRHPFAVECQVCKEVYIHSICGCCLWNIEPSCPFSQRPVYMKMF